MDGLIQLLHSNLIPELEDLERSTSSGDVDAAAVHRLFIVDAFLWIHLGVEIGAFDAEAAGECLDEYIRPFFLSLNSSGSGERVDSPTLYGNHSNESWALIIALPHFAGILIEKAMRGDSDLLYSGQSLFSRPRELVTLFQSLLLLRDHLQHNAVQQFIRAVNFFSPEKWESAWREKCSPQEVERAEVADFSGPIKASVFAGYLILYRYGLQMRDLFEAFSKDPLLDPTDLIKAHDRVREMSKWPVNLSSRSSSEHLGLVQTEIAEEIENQVGSEGVSSSLVSAIQQSMNESLEFIGIPTYISVSV
jgi:hypothetical protein